MAPPRALNGTRLRRGTLRAEPGSMPARQVPKPVRSCAAAGGEIYEAFILPVSHPGLRGRNEDAMPGDTNQPQGPILEPWRILALALIVAAGMLFVHMIVPADAAADPARNTPAALHGPQP